MNRLAVVSSIFAVLVGQSLAQGATNTTNSRAHDRAPTNGPEQVPGHASTLPAGWQNAIPVPVDLTPRPPLPAGVGEDLVTYDCLTGVERSHPRPFPAGPGAACRPPSEATAFLPEGIDNWPGNLGQINSAVFPWGTQVRIFMTQGGVPMIGSGTLIDARVVITAGHVVATRGPGSAWSTNVVVAPAWDGDADAFGTSNALALATFTGWTGAGSLDDDLGYIRLDRPLGPMTGWLGYGHNGNNGYFTGSVFNMAGYPGCPAAPILCCFANSPNQLYYGTGSYDTTTASRLTSGVGWACDTGGVSGAGSYTIDANNARVVYAVHSTRTYGINPTQLGHTRLTQGKYDYADQTWIPGTYSNATADYVPLKCRTSSIGFQGGRLPSFEYLKFHNSLVDPSPRIANVSVYLSTNDVISTADRLVETHTVTWDFGPKSWVRVIGNPPPTIPANTPPGDYWIGVLLTDADGNNANNATSGWDAQRISIRRHWPNVPAGTAAVGTGFFLDFEAQAGTVPAWMTINRVDAITRLDHADAFCNIGQLAVCTDPLSGSFDLEMGRRPGAAGGLVGNAVILRLNGAGSGPLTLDFMARDYSDDSDYDDGVWLSSDATLWQRVHGHWLSLPNAWTSVHTHDLAATPVSTNGVFYLMFAEQSNGAFPGQDGVAIDDIRVHPRPQATMTVSGLVSGQTAMLNLTSGTPGSFGTIALSLSGPGPVPTPFGNVLLSPPIAIDVTATFGGPGGLHSAFPVPNGFAGTQIWFQGFDWAQMRLSNGLVLRIR